jgi:hypothetical protein
VSQSFIIHSWLLDASEVIVSWEDRFTVHPFVRQFRLGFYRLIFLRNENLNEGPFENEQSGHNGKQGKKDFMALRCS